MGFGARAIAQQRGYRYVPPTTPKQLAVSQEEKEDLEWARGLWEKKRSLTSIAAETGLSIERLRAEFMFNIGPNDGR